MSEDRIEGGAKQAKGAVKDFAGKVLGDDKMQAGGAADKAIGKAQDGYGQAVQQLQKAKEDVLSYTSDQPWMALAAALGAGLLLGHVGGRSRRKIVYVHKVKPSEVG